METELIQLDFSAYQTDEEKNLFLLSEYRRCKEEYGEENVSVFINGWKVSTSDSVTIFYV